MRFFKSLLLVLVFAGVGFAAPWLGVSFKKTQFENHLALKVVGVHPNSGCFSAGVVAEDLIIGFEGKPLMNVSDITGVVSKSKVGQSFKLEILREGKKTTLTAKITDRPDDVSSLTGSAVGSKMAEFGKNFYQNGNLRKEKPKATLLDFWATWCGPCRKTLPILESVYGKLGGQGLEVIGVSNENLSTLNAFYEKQHKAPYPLYRDATQELWFRYGIKAVPTLMLLDKDGYIKGVWSGVPHQPSLEKRIKEVMEGN